MEFEKKIWGQNENFNTFLFTFSANVLIINT